MFRSSQKVRNTFTTSTLTQFQRSFSKFQCNFQHKPTLPTQQKFSTLSITSRSFSTSPTSTLFLFKPQHSLLKPSTTFNSTTSITKYKHIPYYSQRRHMGIGSYFSDKIEGKKMEMQQHKERESFRHLRDFLISCPKFRFKENLAYVEAMQAQVGKTDRLIGGQDIKQQEEIMKKKCEVFKAMSPLELLQESPGALNMAAKSRISVATGIDRKQIESELKQFDELKTMHTWLQKRLKNGKTLPENSVDMQKLMAEDPPPPSYNQIKMMQKARQAQRRGPM